MFRTNILASWLVTMFFQTNQAKKNTIESGRRKNTRFNSRAPVRDTSVRHVFKFSSADVIGKVWFNISTKEVQQKQTLLLDNRLILHMGPIQQTPILCGKSLTSRGQQKSVFRVVGWATHHISMNKNARRLVILETYFSLQNIGAKNSIQNHLRTKVATTSTSYQWCYISYKWPHKWITGVKTPTSGVIAPSFGWFWSLRSWHATDHSADDAEPHKKKWCLFCPHPSGHPLV